MTSTEVQAVVAHELASWQAPVAEPGETHGEPWSPDDYGGAIARLHRALVTPYRETFQLREYDDPNCSRVGGEAEYWVVARTSEMYLWYDERTGEFGVGTPRENSPPVSIGLRGDLVGSFCAW